MVSLTSTSITNTNIFKGFRLSWNVWPSQLAARFLMPVQWCNVRTTNRLRRARFRNHRWFVHAIWICHSQHTSRTLQEHFGLCRRWGLRPDQVIASVCLFLGFSTARMPSERKWKIYPHVRQPVSIGRTIDSRAHVPIPHTTPVLLWIRYSPTARLMRPYR